MDGNLVVTDKSAVKDLVHQLGPLLKQHGYSRKLFLKLLARYWVASCCRDMANHTGYLPRLGGGFPCPA
jgi:hypothetical protein